MQYQSHMEVDTHMYLPPLVVDRANASSTGGCQKSPKCVIDKGGGVSTTRPGF